MTKALESILGPYIAITPYISLMYSLLPFYNHWKEYRRALWKCCSTGQSIQCGHGGERGKWIGRQNRQTCWICKTLITAPLTDRVQCHVVVLCQWKHFILLSKWNLNLLTPHISFSALNTVCQAMLKRQKSSSRWQHWSSDSGYASVSLVGLHLSGDVRWLLCCEREKKCWI